MLKNARQRGDTLIEVMLAVVVLSSVAVGGFSIMNKGMGISMNVLERTEARSRITHQLELLTYIRDQYALSAASGSSLLSYPATLWTDIRNNRTATTSTSPTVCTPGARSFFIEQNPDTTYRLTNYVATNPQGVPKPGDGMWIEAVASPGSVGVTYIDFYVKACWDSVVGTQDEIISSTVRLYDRSI